jgi:hypothetical protein
MNLSKLTQKQTLTSRDGQSFYPGIANNTNITFSVKQTALIEKGLKYNVHTVEKNWIVNLTLEVEITVITTTCEYYRKKSSERMETLHTQSESNSNHILYSEIRTLKSIKTKLKNNNAMIAKANKGTLYSHFPYVTVRHGNTKLHNIKSFSNHQH